MSNRSTVARRDRELARRERGSALVVALMATVLMTAFGAALILISSTETRIAAGYRSGAEALSAADAAVEVALVDLAALNNWDAALGGAVMSSFTDGAPEGVRAVAGSQVNLTEATNALRCGRPAPVCGEADMTAFTAERPWGTNNPRWQPYAWGPLSRLVPSAPADSDFYLMVWIADDQGETDGDPLHDGALPDNPGRGTLVLTAHAYGARSVRRVVEATVRRREGPAAVISWREIR